MRSTQELQTQVRETVRARLSLIVVSLIVLIFASTILSSVLLAPILTLSMTGPSVIISFILTVLALYLSCAIIIFLVYGFSIILGRFYRNEPAVLGYLAWGVRDWKRMSLVSLFASIIIFAALFIVAIPTMWIMKEFDTSTEEGVMQMINSFAIMLPVILLVITAMVLPAFMPFMFTFPIMFHEKNMKLSDVFRKSRALLKGRKWRLFCFAMRCAMYPFVTCVVCLAGLFLLPAESSLGSLMGLVFSVSFYYCLVYIVLAVIAYYYELADPDTLCIAAVPDPSQETGCESLPEEPNQKMW